MNNTELFCIIFFSITGFFIFINLIRYYICNNKNKIIPSNILENGFNSIQLENERV